MANQKYTMNIGEKIIFKVSCVRHGFWGAYTHILVVTNQCVILEEYGMFNNFKGVIRYPLSEINQAIIGKASNGENQLELYCGSGKEDFALQSGDENELRTLAMAINDQLSENSECYDYSYYQEIIDGTKKELNVIETESVAANTNSEYDYSVGIGFAGDVMKNMLKSGDISMKGLQKGINKASKKQTKKKTLGVTKDKIFDEIGVHDIQDCFTEIGNDFREDFGLKPKMTHEERRELREQEEKQQKREAYRRSVEKARQSKQILDSKIKGERMMEDKKTLSVNEQIETLKKLKELLDMGILSEEEFESKKKQILNL